MLYNKCYPVHMIYIFCLINKTHSKSHPDHRSLFHHCRQTTFNTAQTRVQSCCHPGDHCRCLLHPSHTQFRREDIVSQSMTPHVQDTHQYVWGPRPRVQAELYGETEGLPAIVVSLLHHGHECLSGMSSFQISQICTKNFHLKLFHLFSFNYVPDLLTPCNVRMWSYLTS